MKPEEIRTTEPFQSLFPIERQVLDLVQEDMQKHGYDASQPIVLWTEKGVVIDSHTRLEAAKGTGLEDVPVHEKSFADEDEALAYAIHNQKDRRNLTPADILRLVDTLDTRLKRGERTDLASGDAKSPEASKRKSAAKTAATIGVSQSTVERTRTILEHAPLQVKEEVKKGKKSIKAAYEETQAGRKIKKETKPSMAQKTEYVPEGANDKKGLQEVKQPPPSSHQQTNGPRRSELYFFEAEQFTAAAISQLTRVKIDQRAIPFLMKVRNYIDDLIGKINHEKQKSRIHSEADYFATVAISLLSEVSYKDPGKIKAFMEVKDYVDKKLEDLTCVPASRSLPETKVSPPPGGSGEPCPSPQDCEPEAEEQKLPTINDDSDNHCSVPASTDEPDSSPSEIGDHPDAGDLGASRAVGSHQNLCSDCRKFLPSPEEPDKGSCEKYPKPFRVGKGAICCDFKSKDSSDASGPFQEVPAKMEESQSMKPAS